MNEIAYIFQVIAVLQIIGDPSSRRFRSHPESISIYLAPRYKEAKLTNIYRPDIIREGVTKKPMWKDFAAVQRF